MLLLKDSLLKWMDLKPHSSCGVRDRKDTKDSVSFLYSGDMDSLLRTLSAGQVNDLTITEPDLEEVFLHYYEKDGETV